MFFKKKESKVSAPSKPELLAVQSGEIIDVASLPDPVFAEKILGDGFAILPEGGEILSPVNGKIVDVQDSMHAYGIETDDGLEILVHIGINTVGLNGKGFKAKVKNGQRVTAGQTLAVADLDFIKSQGLPTYVIVLITDMDDVESIKCNYGKAAAGETVALTYVK